MGTTSLIWINTNYLDITRLTPSAFSNADVQDGVINFTDAGYVKYNLTWEATGNIDVFNTPNIRLRFTVGCNDLADIAYRTDILVSIALYYWQPSDDGTYSKVPGPILNLVPTPKSSGNEYSYVSIHAVDESMLIAEMEITFRCTSYHGQTISDVSLNRAKSLNDTINQNISSAMSRNLLASLDFYTNGFVATYDGETLTYTYLVEGDKLKGLVHQPSGVIVYLNEYNTPIP